MVSLLKTYRLPDEPVQNLNLFSKAWDECIELQSNPRDVWVGRSLLGLQGMARWELGAICDGTVVGGIVLAHVAWDAHVGDCIGVFAQYVLPEYRLKGVSPRLMREALRIAKHAGANTLSYTHRKGPWRYETIYRRIPHADTEH